MYSQYIDGSFSPLAEHRQQKRAGSSPKITNEKSRQNSLLSELGGGVSQFLTNLTKQFSGNQFDTGDILLVLIILFLFLEGDNLELVITLGLMLLFGLNDD